MKKVLLLMSVALLVWSCIPKEKNGKIADTDTQQQHKKPNIIVIVIDDAGYVDFGFMGSKDLETPRIDSMALDGIICTDAHVSATVCAPSRAGILTGQYQQRFGFEANGTGDEDSGDIGLADDVLTMAEIFQQNDYKTIAIGKWHLGGTESDHPNNRGFDEFYGFIAGARSYFPIENPDKAHMLQHNGERVLFEGYLTDVLGDQSVSFVEQHKDQPFFMYLAFNAVHTPMEAKKSDLEKYKDHPRQTLAAMTWSLDENIGKLRNKLRELSLLDNTLIYFVSDNGGAFNNQSTNGHLKGWKGNKFEAGHRVPFIISWPSALRGGQHFGGLVSSLDIFSTSLAAAGIDKEEDMILDGANLVPYLTGEKTGTPHKALYWRKLEEAAARIGDFKLIRLKDYGSTLYNLSTDIGETDDLSSRDTLMHSHLLKGLSDWEADMSEPLWDEGRPWMDVTYHIHKQLMQNKKALYKSPAEKKNLSVH